VKRNTTKKVSINELNNQVIPIEKTKDAVEVETKDVSNTTKIDDLPPGTNNNQQENVSNNLKNE
jgi:hypothetical protein